jgi:hypothetical protein
VGEMTNVLIEVYGRYQEPIRFWEYYNCLQTVIWGLWNYEAHLKYFKHAIKMRNFKGYIFVISKQ